MRIGLISDTHGLLRAEVFDALQGVDRILHAGDVGGVGILDELRAIAPVDAVIGNTDGRELQSLPDEVTLELAGRKVVVTHGHLLGSPTVENLRATWPEADVIVYGHTHVQKVERDGPLVVNPGAAGPARFRLKPSVAILTLDDDGERVDLLELAG